jgi:hypothetical protein
MPRTHSSRRALPHARSHSVFEFVRQRPRPLNVDPFSSFRNPHATPSLFHQHHPGRLRRSSRRDKRDRSKTGRGGFNAFAAGRWAVGSHPAGGNPCVKLRGARRGNASRRGGGAGAWCGGARVQFKDSCYRGDSACFRIENARFGMKRSCFGFQLARFGSQVARFRC